MEIKTYKKLRGNVYQITMDNGDDYKLYDDIILKYELLIDRKLDSKKMERIVEENNELEAYYKALKYISLKMRTELEVRKYLKKYELSHKAINKAIEKLKRDGYLNPDKYAEAYVNDALNLGSNGPRKIRDNLEKLGIADEHIEKYLCKIDSEVWQCRIERILNKKSKSNKSGALLFKNKAFSDLSVLGYYAEDIKSVLENFVVDTTQVFLKEADKTYDKLLKKYSGKELELRFKSKMYAKGFDGDVISDYLDRK